MILYKTADTTEKASINLKRRMAGWDPIYRFKQLKGKSFIMQLPWMVGTFHNSLASFKRIFLSKIHVTINAYFKK
jgi:hypothetical protein